MGHTEIPIEERVVTKTNDRKSKIENGRPIGTRSTNRMQMTYAEAVTGRREVRDDVTGRKMMNDDVKTGMRGGEPFSKR